MPSPLGPFLSLWKQRVGLVAPGRAGKVLFPAINEWGVERTLKALENYLKDPKINVHRLEYFVESAVKYLPPDPAVPPPPPPPPPLLVGTDGDLNEAGVRAYYGRP